MCCGRVDSTENLVSFTVWLNSPTARSRKASKFADAIRVAGEEAVCLGSDFDGMVPLPSGMRDVTDLWKLTAILLRRGHPRRRIERVLGLNLRRFLTEVLANLGRHSGDAPPPRVSERPTEGGRGAG